MNIILCGACGKMGRMVAELAAAQGENIVCGVDIAPAPMAFPVYTSFAEVDASKKADVLIDFSSPSHLEERLRFCETRGIPAVLAATGYTEADIALIENYATRVPIFKTGNLSLGVNILQRLVKEAARALGDGFDAEIVECHHREKKDAPSGTALMLAESVNEGFGGDRENVYGRHGAVGARKTGEIGVHAVRGGTIVGEHEVMFAGEDEILTLSHSARSRKVFAAGALKAAHFMLKKRPGLYDMDDLLDGILK